MNLSKTTKAIFGHQRALGFNTLWNQRLKIPSKFDFRLEFSDFDKISFAMNSKYGDVFMVIFNDFLYYLFIEIIFEGSFFELEKSVFEVKHTCTFWTIECT
jgi:hypothetical protein